MRTRLKTALQTVLLAPNGRPAKAEIVRARYEAATSNNYRSTIPSTLRDARLDADRYTRHELARLGWHLYQNSPFIRSLIERLVTYIIGSGIRPIATSSDPEWNATANARWAELSSSIEYLSGLSWPVYTEQVCRCAMVAGDCLTVYVDDDEGLRLRLFESHNVDSQYVSTAILPANTKDGVTTNAKGQVTYYVFTDGKKVPADMAVLHWFPERPAQYRGVSLLASMLNTARDVEDILGLEKAAVKDASAKTDIITTATGELDDESILRGTIAGADDVDRSDYYRSIIGPEAKVIKAGDQYTPYVSTRPSPAWAGFMEFLTQTICLASGLPPSVFLQMKVGGADTRRDLATAQRVIERYQLKLSEQFTRIRNHLVQADIETGALPKAPRDWDRVRWQTPKAITVDSGREAQQDREDVRMGLLTREEYWGRYGLDPSDQDRQVIAEAVQRRELLRGVGLSLDEFTRLLRLETSDVAPGATQQNEEEHQ